MEPQQSFPEVWDEPDTNFEAFVADTVKHRLGKYVQPDHPNRISKEDAQMLYRWARTYFGSPVMHFVHALAAVYRAFLLVPT